MCNILATIIILKLDFSQSVNYYNNDIYTTKTLHYKVYNNSKFVRVFGSAPKIRVNRVNNCTQFELAGLSMQIKWLLQFIIIIDPASFHNIILLCHRIEAMEQPWNEDS